MSKVVLNFRKDQSADKFDGKRTKNQTAIAKLVAPSKQSQQFSTNRYRQHA